MKQNSIEEVNTQGYGFWLLSWLRLMQPKYFQIIIISLMLLVGAMSMANGSPLVTLRKSLSCIYELLQMLPFVEGRISTLEKYRNAADVIVLSWFLSLLSMFYFMIYMTIMLTRNKLYPINGQLDLMAIVDSEFYSKACLSMLRPSGWLTIQKNHSIDSEMSGQLEKAIPLSKAISLALRFDVLKRHVLISATLVMGILYLDSTGAGGLLSRTALSFYFGYPCLIFLIGAFTAELAVYGLSKILVIAK